jgi:hypothetical protein
MLLTMIIGQHQLSALGGGDSDYVDNLQTAQAGVVPMSSLPDFIVQTTDEFLFGVLDTGVYGDGPGL